MKIRYLGTGDSCGIPSPFCKCRVCENARKKGEKEIRTRTGILIDDDLLIDFPPESMVHFAKYHIDSSQIQSVLLTHTHSDHFYYSDLLPRLAQDTFNIGYKKLTVYGNANAVACLVKRGYSADGNGLSCALELKPFCPERIGTYRVTALPTAHMLDETSYVYLLEKDGESYLHLLDSPELSEEVYAYLKEKKIKAQAVSLDCTFGTIEKEYFGHMNLTQCRRVRDKLCAAEITNADTYFVLTHIAHCCRKTHKELSSLAKQCGMILAYDGMQITIRK